jgi:uncharacterized glyoxalase superfamily protein PhnB
MYDSPNQALSIPAGHQPLMPYLILRDAARFKTFVESVFAARETALSLREDGTILHAEVQLQGCTVMFGESSNTWPPRTAGLYLYVPDVDATFQRAIAHGAQSVMPVTGKDYGRSGGVQDPCGNVWWLTQISAS